MAAVVIETVIGALARMEIREDPAGDTGRSGTEDGR